MTGHSGALAVLCALKVDYPDFYEKLQNEPRLIAAFSEVFLFGRPLTDLTEPLRLALTEYATSEGALETSYRPLEQFVSSTQGLR